MRMIGLFDPSEFVISTEVRSLNAPALGVRIIPSAREQLNIKLYTLMSSDT